MDSIKITLEIPDNKAAFMMELLQNLPFVKATPTRAKGQDATQYLESSPANQARVLAAIEQLENGQYEVHELLPNEQNHLLAGEWEL